MRGKLEESAPAKVAVVGEGPEHDRLMRAYSRRADVELVAAAGGRAAEEAVRIPGLAAVEIAVSGEESVSLASSFIRAGVMTSLEVPSEENAVQELSALGRAYGVPVRYRLLPLYYPPYQEMKRILDEDWLGLPISLKLVARHGRGTEFPDELDPVAWLYQKELGFLALAGRLLGPVEKVYSRLMPCTPEKPVSQAITWKYQEPRQYGFFQLDFCPELHIRTFTEPVHRSLELTCAGGVIMATRGEGQMLRMPALVVRGKSTATAMELVPDEWEEVYNRLAAETTDVLKHKKKDVIGSENDACEALALAASAEQSFRKKTEVFQSLADK